MAIHCMPMLKRLRRPFLQNSLTLYIDNSMYILLHCSCAEHTRDDAESSASAFLRLLCGCGEWASEVLMLKRCSLLIILLPVLTVNAQSRLPSIDDLLNVKSLFGTQISPDGKWIAYTVN